MNYMLDFCHFVAIVKDGRWYTLAMALMGVLSFVALIVVIYIVVYCFVCKKRRDDKQLIYDTGKCGKSNILYNVFLVF